MQAHEVTAVTIAEYDRMAEAYRRGTADHDVSQNIAALLEAIEGEAPHAILDLGCGPGRDLRRFTELGHEAVGLDGSGELVALARDETGCEVLHQDFLALDLPRARFDGIFANASLFHVPSRELPRVLQDLAATLKPDGVLFSSNPRGLRKAGPGGATAASMISSRGAPTSPPRGSGSSATTTARRVGHGPSSRGSPRSGARPPGGGPEAGP